MDIFLICLFTMFLLVITISEIRSLYNPKYRYLTYMLFPIRTLKLTWRIYKLNMILSRCERFDYCMCEVLHKLRRLVYQRDLSTEISKRVFSYNFDKLYNKGMA